MKQKLILALAIAAGTSVGALASAEDLAAVYNTSLTSDATLRQAEAVHMASRETKTQAMLNMLPLNASANKSWTGVGVGSSNSTTNTNPTTATLGLTVNLFSWNSWVNLKSADASTAQAEANFQVAQQSLVSRVTTRYFAVLSAQDQLAALKVALESASRQLEQSERRFEVGLIANTDVEIARAARDSASAAVIASQRSVEAAQEQLRIITGMKYASLATPRADMPLLSPEPASEDAWVATALSQNSTLVAARLAADIAENQYLAAFGGHLPNVTLNANRNWALNGTSTSSSQPNQNTKDITWSAGVSVPLFSAGLTQSKVRAARYNWDAAKSAYDNVSRQIEQQTRDAYQGVISQIAQVRALQQAVASNRISLSATEAGYEVGTKTALDVLTSRQQYVQALTSFALAKYGYLNNIVALRLASGSLDAETIKLINGWLTAPTAGAATP